MCAVVGAAMCVLYLVAFAGMPLYLSVASSPEKDREATESAFRCAEVLDEVELQKRMASYVPWPQKEAEIVRELSASSSSPVASRLRQRKH
jgi:hypothetical protein